MNVDDVVQERIAEARRKVEQEKQQREELAANRREGIKARHTTKARRKGIRLGFCASCARPLMRGTYLLCSKGCGGRLCRGHPRCAQQHNPQCPNRDAQFTDSPQETP
ncbi:hypothetical protein J7E96_09725 [Streptomyces sp. ISL-96]|uniref:hypothetical protein n=1 Tax=Streptomyces sp. ISL-96 TaxID=2819191 RepID=UPI001BEB4DBB|nr:hypothetical protein [Streptomyces sp. ISL-96]MBT2488796.1 hypothetical protein [Streptomyces sp. ISL-96]